MRIDDVEHDEIDGERGNPRRWVIGASLVAVLGLIVVLAVVNRSHDPAVAPAADPADEISDNRPAVGADVIPSPIMPDGFPDSGSDWCCTKLEQLFQRTTDAGIKVTLQDSGDWGGMCCVKPMPMPVDLGGAPAAEAASNSAATGSTGSGSGSSSDSTGVATPAPDEPMPIMPPNTTGPIGWAPPAWCNAIGGFRVTMTYKEAVGSAQGQRFTEPRDGVNVTLFSSGSAEGTPFRVLVLQLAPDVTSAAVRFTDGGADAATPSGGWVVLGVPGPQSGKFSITLQGATGERVIDWKDLPQVGDLGWQKGCNPPPPRLPEPGDQPADPAAAEAQVRAVFERLWDGSESLADKSADVLDDDTGIAEAMAQLKETPFGDEAGNSTHTMTDIVFTSPGEAWFQYDLETSFADFAGRFGVAFLVDGSWRIGRAVLCQDIALAGVQCNPYVDPVAPPGFDLSDGGVRPPVPAITIVVGPEPGPDGATDDATG